MSGGMVGMGGGSGGMGGGSGMSGMGNMMSGMSGMDRGGGGGMMDRMSSVGMDRMNGGGDMRMPVTSRLGGGGGRRSDKIMIANLPLNMSWKELKDKCGTLD